MVIHHVKMNKVSASSLNVPNLFAKSGKICGKDARGNPISRGGSHGFDSRSALAAHGPPDDKKQQCQCDTGFQKDEPHGFTVLDELVRLYGASHCVPIAISHSLALDFFPLPAAASGIGCTIGGSASAHPVFRVAWLAGG
jgi:hypothetical protein